MYKKKSISDFIVVIISLIAFAGLIFVVKYYNVSSSAEQEQLVETGNVNQEIKDEGYLADTAESIVINEVNQAGWLELYNKDKEADIKLSNCYITVNGIMKYTFGEQDVIKACEFLCIDELGSLGTTEHDIIGIFNQNGDNLIDILLPGLETGESYGCRTDGDISYSYLTESKNTSNSASSIISKDKLTFSVPGGFYNESFKLEITAAEGMTIYYTLDGSEPTSKSDVYKDPILIENKSGSNIKYASAEGIEYLYSYRPSSISIGMIVRAIAVDRSGSRSEIKTQSYFVGIKSASELRNIPVLSIVTAPENLFDYFDGIYVSGRSHEDALARGEDGGASANYLNDWEKEVNVEYFEPQKDKTYEGKMSISIIKDISVTLPQKSLLLTSEEGAFSGSSLQNYYNRNSNRLVVQTNLRDNDYKIREYLAGKLLSDTTVGTPDIISCNVFINGEYWGGYMLRAEFDESYIKKHYGVREEDVLIAHNGTVYNNTDYQAEYDELYNFIVNNDLKNNENYEWVKAHLDVQNYIEYFCANMYLANASYGSDNLIMWRTINEQGEGFQDGKWRFMMPRLDISMSNGAIGRIATSSIDTFLQPGVSNDIFFQSFMRNKEFKDQLIQEMTEMADNNFSEKRVDAAISEITEQMKKMVITSYRRFVGNPGDSFYTAEVEKIENFFQQRRKYILLYTEEVIKQGVSFNARDDALSE
jgi:hypothetical protein